jgi:hypothetical protein
MRPVLTQGPVIRVLFASHQAQILSLVVSNYSAQGTLEDGIGLRTCSPVCLELSVNLTFYHEAQRLL